MIPRKDRGAALVLSLMALVLLAAFGFALSILANVDRRAAAAGVMAQDARHAAEAALEFAQLELIALPDWSLVTAGFVQSAFVSGVASAQVLSDGTTVNLLQITSGLPEPDWRLFAFGPAKQLGGLPSDASVAVWVRPWPGHPGSLVVRADAFGAGATRRSVIALLAPEGPLSWKEVR